MFLFQSLRSLQAIIILTSAYMILPTRDYKIAVKSFPYETVLKYYLKLLSYTCVIQLCFIIHIYLVFSNSH